MAGGRCVAALLAAGMAAAAPASAEVWQVASEEHYPPYCYGPTGARHGIDHDIVAAILDTIGVTAAPVVLPWKRLVQMMDENKVDLAYQFAPSEERFAKWHMVGPFREVPWSLAVEAQTPIESWQTLADLRSYKVGTVAGYAYPKPFAEDAAIRKDESTDIQIGLRKLLVNRVDIVVSDPNVLSFLAAEAGVAHRVRFLRKPLATLGRYIALPGAQQLKAERFAAAFAAARDQGRIQSILDRWKYIAGGESRFP